MTTTREHPKATIYRFNAPAGGFLRLYEQSGMYCVESDAEGGLIDPTANFASAKHQFEHLLAERYDFEWVTGPTSITLMDKRNGRPLMIENRPDGDYGSW